MMKNEKMYGYISLNEFARRHNMTKSTLQRAIKSGRVTSVMYDPSGRCIGVDPDRAPQEWVDNTDQGQAAKSGRIFTVPNQDQSYQGYRAKREKYNAAIAELEYLEKADALVSQVEVYREMTKILTQLKNKIFRIADKKSQEIANEADPVSIEKLLRRELTKVFDEYSRDLSGLQVDDY